MCESCSQMWYQNKAYTLGHNILALKRGSGKKKKTAKFIRFKVDNIPDHHHLGFIKSQQVDSRKSFSSLTKILAQMKAGPHKMKNLWSQ